MERCACNEPVAAAIIAASRTGVPQNVNGERENLVDWTINKHIRGRYAFELVENVEDAQRALAVHSSPKVENYDWHVYPNIAKAVQRLLDDGKLMRKLDVVKAFVVVDTPEADRLAMDTQVNLAAEQVGSDLLGSTKPTGAELTL